jgi:(S)-2-hydroxy-acid oxidase
VRSSVEILPEVVEVKRTHPGVEVYVDGGIRYGADIFKCLALGADFVFLGRPLIWANAVGGVDGQVKLLEILKQELRLAMILSGTASIGQINSSYVINYLQPRPKL